MSVQKIITGLHAAWVIFHCDMESEVDNPEFPTNLQGFLFYSSDPCKASEHAAIFEQKEEMQRAAPLAIVHPDANLF